MIAVAKENDDEKPQRSGFQIEGIRDVRHLARALEQERIDLGDLPENIIEQVDTFIKSGKVSLRGLTSALRVIGQLKKMNADITMKLLDKAAPDQHEHTHHVGELRQALSDARTDKSFVELERQRALAHGGVAGANGSNGKSRPMGDGPAPRAG